MQLIETCKIIGAADPKNFTGATFAGKYISLKNYSHVTVVIHTGAWAAGTAAVTLSQATVVAATDAKALTFAYQWTGTAASALLTKTAVTANTFDLAVANTMYVIEVDAETLDIGGGFDCFSVLVASPGANADFYNIDYILSEPRFAQAALPTAILD